MPAVSEKQRRAMFAAAAGHSNLGIPKSVGEEFVASDPGGKLPAKAKDLAPSKWETLKRLISEWLTEEQAEPEHAGDEIPKVRAAGVAFVTPTGDCLFLRRAARGHPGDHATEWCLPGGVIEDGETPAQTAMREAREEVGQDCVAADAWDLRPAHHHTHDGVDFTTFYQPVKMAFDPVLNDEHTAFKWAADCPEPAHPGVRKAFDEIMAGLAQDDAKSDSMTDSTGGFIEPPPAKTAAPEAAIPVTPPPVPVSTLPAAKDEVKHDPSSGQFTSGPGGNVGKSEGTTPQPRATGVELGDVIDLKSRGLKPKLRGSGASTTEAVQVAWGAAKRDGKNYTVLATGLGWKVLKDTDKVPHGQPHITVTPDGKMYGFKPPKAEAKDAGLTPNSGGHLTVGKQRDPNGSFGWAFGGKVGTGRHQMRMSRAVRSDNERLVSRTGEDMAFDRALAEDKKTLDHDGRLHVDSAPLTRSGVFPYLGKEINAVMADEPGWRLLDPERRYNLLRPADEIEKAASTFRGLPILWLHKPASAQDHPSDITIGATGNDVVWEDPFLKASLVIWPAYATEAIEDKSQHHLSAGYAYKAEPRSGTFDGQPYDFIMTNLIGNHVALVKDGRSGPSVAIDWSITEHQWAVLERAILRMAS